MSGKLAITTQPMGDRSGGTLAGTISGQDLDNICEKRWDTELCDCGVNKKQSALTCFCLPCMKCVLADRMGEFPGIGCLLPGGVLAMRVKMRTLFSIKGSICKDCLVSTFLQPCAVCQMTRELDKVGL